MKGCPHNELYPEGEEFKHRLCLDVENAGISYVIFLLLKNINIYITLNRPRGI